MGILLTGLRLKTLTIVIVEISSSLTQIMIEETFTSLNESQRKMDLINCKHSIFDKDYGIKSPRESWLIWIGIKTISFVDLCKSKRDLKLTLI